MNTKKIYQLCKVSESYETSECNGFSLERIKHYYRCFKLKIEDDNLSFCYTSHLFEDRDEACQFAVTCSSSEDILTNLVGRRHVIFEYYWVVPAYIICHE